jgi:hypothetical protein
MIREESAELDVCDSGPVVVSSGAQLRARPTDAAEAVEQAATGDGNQPADRIRPRGGGGQACRHY